MPELHATLSASGSGKWMGCPASLAAEKATGKKDETSEFAAEGTAAHGLGEMCLAKNTVPADHIGDEIKVPMGEGKDPLVFMVDQSMADFVAVYVDYVRGVKGSLMIEERVDFSKWVPDGFGTSDSVIFCEDFETLEIVDLKYGQGVQVFAEDNSQMKLYAAGSLESFCFMADGIKTVRMTIVQPRLWHIDSVEMSVKDLLEWANTEVAPKAIIAKELYDGVRDVCPEDFNPSEKACKWCKAFGSCEAAAQAGVQIAMEGFEDLSEAIEENLKDTGEISPELRGTLTTLLPMLKTWAVAFEAETHRLLEAGIAIPGYKLVLGRGSRKWKSEKDAKNAFRLFKIPKKDYTVEKIISPPATEKIVGKDGKEKLAKYVDKIPGSPSVVRESDKRPAIETGENGFEDLTKTEPENEK